MGGPFRMGKLLSQFRLLFPFLQKASVLWAVRIGVRYAVDKWDSIRHDH